MASQKIGRNDPCPCGSGMKYKRCCLLKEAPAPPLEAPAAPPTLPVGAGADDEMLSAAYWDDLARRLPRRLRRELAPLIERTKLAAGLEARRGEVDAACETLAAHRAAFAALAKDARELDRQAERLFREEAFVPMRYHAADVQRAFAAVGCPAYGVDNESSTQTLKDALFFLADDEQCETMANRLLLLLPETVRAGRYLHGCIIEDSVAALLEGGESRLCPFLLAMFRHGLQEWENERQQEQMDLLGAFDLTPEQVQEMGYEGIQAWMKGLESSPQKLAAAERFLAEHPEFSALSEARCRAHESAAIDLLQREDARSLLLSPEEVEPWVRPLTERLTSDPVLTRSATRAKRPSKAVGEAFNRAFFDVGAEMAQAILTPERLDRLAERIHEYRRQLSPADLEAAEDGIHGALAAAQSRSVAADQVDFLVVLCCLSLKALLEDMDPG